MSRWNSRRGIPGRRRGRRGAPLLALAILLGAPSGRAAASGACPEDVEAILRSARQLRSGAARKSVLDGLGRCVQVTRLVRELRTFPSSPALAEAFRELSRRDGLTEDEAEAILRASGILSSLRTRQQVILNLIGKARHDDVLRSARMLPGPLMQKVLVSLIPPTAQPVLPLEVAERGAAITIDLPASDPSGDVLEYRIVRWPGHGELKGAGRRRTYRPFRDYQGGPDSFDFRVSDGKLDSNVVTVSITVTPVNDPPAASGQTVSIPEKTSVVEITVTATDVDNDHDELSFHLVSGPHPGRLEGALPTVRYRPASEYFFGPDRFSFAVSDGAAESAPAEVRIDVTPVNDAPVAHDLTVGPIDAGSTVSITLSASDVDNGPDELTYQFTQATNGRVVGVMGTRDTVTYTPNPGAVTDRFQVWALDFDSRSQPATVTITVRPAAGS